ncbi:hypothetical protein [Ottowia sp.]|uniref:hypothetical protein n=1 Tax=Ottowia sp. TaxID=1898956 RepID=UPI0025FAD2FD|nr:hypothetical protein [Ottowia sp.]MBK6616429.1 hypothetical protein [Ottowia sp.]
MHTELDQAYFESLVDFQAAGERVSVCLRSLTADSDLLRFMVRYASWNGSFSNGVSRLASEIGNCRDLFREKGFPRAASDRSNYVASFIFDAARDEYDDHVLPMRDTHRCMAQAGLMSMAEFLQLGHAILDEEEPIDLVRLNDRVGRGYGGQALAMCGVIGCVFAGIGYHLGSELLADQEFSMIDQHLRSSRNDLVQHLMRSTVKLAGGEHRCYAWVGVHSGHGGGVEADHFDLALRGVRAAFEFLVGDERVRKVATTAVSEGFKAFERDHQSFFAMSTLATAGATPA